MAKFENGSLARWWFLLPGQHLGADSFEPFFVEALPELADGSR
jgi:hypothetical protein